MLFKDIKVGETFKCSSDSREFVYIKFNELQCRVIVDCGVECIAFTKFEARLDHEEFI